MSSQYVPNLLTPKDWIEVTNKGIELATFRSYHHDHYKLKKKKH